MRGLISHCIISILLPTFSYTFADENLPQAIAVLGDSLSEGMLSNYSIENPPPKLEILKMLQIGLSSDKEERLAEFRKRYADKSHSWATGDNENDIVESHLERLRSKSPEIRAFNYAVSSSKSSELDEPVDRLLLEMQNERLSLDYLMLLIGANDLNADKLEDMTSPLAYVGNLERNLRRILDIYPWMRVLVMGLPQITDIFERSKNIIAYQTIGTQISCDRMRKMIYGPALIFHPENPDYPAVIDLIKSYDEGIQNLIVRLQEDFPEAQLKTIQGYGSSQNIKKALSIDCFHPSSWGQAEFAELSWREGFFADRL